MGIKIIIIHSTKQQNLLRLLHNLAKISVMKNAFSHCHERLPVSLKIYKSAFKGRGMLVQAKDMLNYFVE